MPAEHVVLNARDIGNIDAGAQQILRGLLGLGEDRIRLQLFVVGRADHQRPADLGVIAVHLRGELRGDTVAGLELAPGGRLHAGHFGTAGSDQHEVIFGAIGLEEGFDLGDELVLGHPGLAHLDELLVAAVGEAAQGIRSDPTASRGAFYTATAALNTTRIIIPAPAAVTSVAVSPDGHTVASATRDATVRLWNVTEPAHPVPLGQLDRPQRRREQCGV